MYSARLNCSPFFLTVQRIERQLQDSRGPQPQQDPGHEVLLGHLVGPVVVQRHRPVDKEPSEAADDHHAVEHRRQRRRNTVARPGVGLTYFHLSTVLRSSKLVCFPGELRRDNLKDVLAKFLTLGLVCCLIFEYGCSNCKLNCYIIK